MKIGFVLPGSVDSGGVRTTVAMANGLKARGHRARLFCRGVGSVRAWSEHVRRKFMHRKGPDWIGHSRLSVSFYDRVADCRFEPDELIVGIGMWVSAQMAELRHLPNRKLQYIHGATPWDPVTMKQALSLPLPENCSCKVPEQLIHEQAGARWLR